MSASPRRDGYETDPVAVGRGRSGSRRLAALVVIVVAGIGLAIAKPWGGPAGSAVALVEPASSTEQESFSSDRGAPFGAIGVPGASPTNVVDREFDGDFAGILARLGERTGTWGIATGDSTPGSGAPWALWSPVTPRASDGSALPPDCAGVDLHPSGAVVAITVPAGLGAAWSVSAVATGPGGRPLPVATRRVGASGGAGSTVAFLMRADETGWGSGAFRFVVTGLRGSVALDTCLIAIPAAGTLPSIAQTLDLGASGAATSRSVAPPERRLPNGREPGYP